MKDIFVDAQIANLFAEPPNEHYVKFICWLTGKKEENYAGEGYLVLSNKLINEYIGGCRLSSKETSIGAIIDLLIKKNRYNKFSAKEIKDFQSKHFSKKLWNELKSKRSGSCDPDHIAIVLLSSRKMALSQDENLIHDLLNFPKFKKKVVVGRSPEKVPYSD
jgi:hypothetical protein